jgi:hypothetical protein
MPGSRISSRLLALHEGDESRLGLVGFQQRLPLTSLEMSGISPYITFRGDGNVDPTDTFSPH